MRSSSQIATLLAVALLGVSGCALLLTEAVVSTPRRLNPLHATPLPLPAKTLGIRERFTVPVDLTGEVEIAVSVLDPPALAEPRGTVLVLHGIRAEGLWMLDIGRALARSGYRAVLVDLRGHGGSSGDVLTFGVHEARDLARVMDELDARGLLAGPIAALGHSYGATTAIHLAAIDPRIATVVAIAPFADMRDEVPHYVRTMLPGLGHALPDDFYQRVIDDAGRRGGFDPDDASAEKAIERATCPVLFMHGLDDLVVPASNSQRLFDRAPPGSRLVYLKDVGHFGAWLDADGRVERESLAWLDRWLTE